MSSLMKISRLTTPQLSSTHGEAESFGAIIACSYVDMKSSPYGRGEAQPF
jgi:hypothetical protein